MHTRNDAFPVPRLCATWLILAAAGSAAPAADTSSAISRPWPAAAQPAATDTVVPGSAAINAAWRSWREALDARAAFLDPRELAATADRYRTWLVELGRDLPRPLPSVQTDSPWRQALAVEGDAQREAALRRILGRISAQAPMLDDPAVAAEIDAAQRALAAWSNRARLLSTDLQSIETALAQARTLEEGGPGSVRAIVEKWTREGLTRQPGVRAAVAPVLDRVELISRIDRETATGELLRIAQSARQDQPDLLFSAWRRLSARGQTLWPMNESDLAAEVALRPALLRAADAIRDQERATFLRDEVVVEQSRRLTRLLSVATNDATLAAADKAIRDLDLPEQNLDGRIRYNLLLNRLKQSISAPGVTDERSRELARKFVADVRDLQGGIAFLSGANTVVAALDAVSGGLELSPATVEPGRFGPAAAGLGSGVENGPTMIFNLPARSGAAATTLEFVLVGEGLSASYITVNEVTVGQVAAIAAARNAERSLAKVLPTFRPLDDSRLGPRSWTWGRDEFDVPRVIPAPNWLSPVAVLGGVDYPSDLLPAPPSNDSPMQHVPAAAAAYIAALAGCRIPTIGEWQSLLKEQSPDSRAELANLRDARWALYSNHMKAREAAGKWFQPADAGAFVPAGPAQMTAAAHPWDDGVLWFSPAAHDANQAASHVLGNVAEFVTTVPWELPSEPEAAAALVAGQLKQLKVIGGSALSHPEIDPHTPQELDPIDALEGFADVGFRLAFGAEKLSTAGGRVGRQVVEILTPTPYLKPR